MPEKTILLVEDHPDDAQLTLRAFRKCGVDGKMVVVSDGVEALDYLHGAGAHAGSGPAALPAVVLLDLQLPKLSGVEVLRRLRSHERTRLLPVVMLTSSVDPYDVLQSYRAGANGYARKAIDSERMLEVVRRIAAFWLQVNERPPGDEPARIAPGGEEKSR